MLIGALLVLLSSGSASAADDAPRAPQGYDALQGELRVGADVLRSALRDNLPGLRVVDVEAGYLAGQGVLIVIDVASPWFRIDSDDLDLDPVITSLEEIPDMVHQILAELDLGLSPQQTEELYELRGLRDSQRSLRAEQRALRGSIREQRRKRLHSESPEAVAAIDEQLVALEAELDALRDQERHLAQEAERTRGTLDAPVSRRPEPPPSPLGIDHAIATSLCSYGSTFKTPDADEHMNVLVRERQGTRYYVFTMAEVRGCEGDGADALLERGFRYSTSTRSR